MKFLADECVDKEIVEAIRKLKIEVIYIAEINPRVDDNYILSFASKKDAVLITSDKDFGELIFRQKKISAGIILLRLEGLEKKKKIKLITAAIETLGSELKNGITVISGKQIRLRKFE